MLTKLLSKVKQEKQQKVESPVKKENTEDDKKAVIEKLKDVYLSSRPNLSWDLEKYKMPKIDTVYYIPNFITEEDAQYLNAQIYTQPKERWYHLAHSNRRLQKWGGDVTKDGLDNQEPLPDWLEKISEILQNEHITQKKTNHVLLNEYEAGIGIMPHTDGPLYHPYVVILSLGSSIFFEFFKNYQAYKSSDYLCTLLVELRSLLIFTDKAYHEVLHCIEDNKIDFIQVHYKVTEDNKLEVTHTNVDNLMQTNYFKKLEEEVLKDPKIEKGVEYKRVDENKREPRISLTIRYVPEMNNK